RTLSAGDPPVLGEAFTLTTGPPCPAAGHREGGLQRLGACSARRRPGRKALLERSKRVAAGEAGAGPITSPRSTPSNAASPSPCEATQSSICASARRHASSVRDRI